MRTYVNCKTPEEFDAGYANHIDAAVVARWETHFRQKSEAVLGSSVRRIELAYGPDERQRIDFFPSPVAAADAPTLVAIHGGLWFLFGPWMMHFLVPAFTAAGVHVACPGYRLAPHHTLDEIIADSRAAVAFLAARSATLKLAPSRISLIGHSAAGQIAAVLASTSWATPDPGSWSGPRFWIGVSGFYEIEPFALTGFQPLVGFTPEAYQRWNPMNLVRPKSTPGLLVTGGRESAWIHEMAEAYQGALGKAGVAATWFDAAEECHFSVLSRVGDAGSAIHRMVLARL